jgi:hypothetical protein
MTDLGVIAALAALLAGPAAFGAGLLAERARTGKHPIGRARAWCLAAMALTATAALMAAI